MERKTPGRQLPDAKSEGCFGDGLVASLSQHVRYMGSSLIKDAADNIAGRDHSLHDSREESFLHSASHPQGLSFPPPDEMLMLYQLTHK